MTLRGGNAQRDTISPTSAPPPINIRRELLGGETFTHKMVAFGWAHHGSALQFFSQLERVEM